MHYTQVEVGVNLLVGSPVGGVSRHQSFMAPTTSLLRHDAHVDQLRSESLSLSVAYDSSYVMGVPKVYRNTH